MRAKYFPNLFKAKYPSLRGSDWVRTIDDEDLQFFIREGLKAADYGKMGGRAIVEKKGKEYMSRIGRIGAIATNSKKAWIRAIQDEIEKLGDL